MWKFSRLMYWNASRCRLGGQPASASGDRAQLFQQVLQHVERDFVDTLSDSAVYARAAEGLIGELHDPHSAYLSPRLLQSLSERTAGRYAGVGIQVDARDGFVIVLSPLPGGPAITAGIQPGDRIVIQAGARPIKRPEVHDLLERLEELGVPDAWKLVEPLVAAGLDADLVGRVAVIAGRALFSLSA